jgi:glycosyltransferase involved in cell wall biosynthesis
MNGLNTILNAPLVATSAAMNNVCNAMGKAPPRKLAVPGELLEPELSNVCASREAPALEKPRLLLLARSLNRGGAQRQLVMLARGLRARGWGVSVAQFYTGDPWEEELRRADVALHDLRKRGRWDVLRFLFRLGRLLRKEQPTILHGYLSVPNLLTVLSCFLSPKTHIVWGIFASTADLDRGWLVRFTFFIERATARFADLILSNSSAGRDYYAAHGYPRHKIVVIPNGIDTERFQFDVGGRQRLRSAWEISTEEVLIGVVGRLDPLKDHPTFLRAASLLAKQDKCYRFVCVGDGPSEYANKLRQEAQALGLNDRLIWVCGRDDMAAVYSAFDIACSSSCSEGLPNVVLEAMGCSRPCVVTDVGDSATVVGDTGKVVPPGDPLVLSGALAHLTLLGPKEWSLLGLQARMRIVEQFSLDRHLDATAEALRRL